MKSVSHAQKATPARPARRATRRGKERERDARDDVQSIPPRRVAASRALDEAGTNRALAHERAGGGVPGGGDGEEDVGSICRSDRASARCASS